MFSPEKIEARVDKWMDGWMDGWMDNLVPLRFNIP